MSTLAVFFSGEQLACQDNGRPARERGDNGHFVGLGARSMKRRAPVAATAATPPSSEAGRAGGRSVPRARWVQAPSDIGPREARRMSARDQSAGPTSPRLLARCFAALRAAIPHRPSREQAGTHVADGAEGPVLRRTRWHYIYFVLAAFDLLTVTGSLHLSHRIMAIYAASVDTNQRWADRLARYADLGQLAAAVDAPGNDVFDTRDVDAEATRQAQALAVFERALDATRADLAAGPLLAGLDAVAGAMRDMVAEAEQIFAHFRRGETGLAGARMATMDRKYARVSAELAALGGR